MNEHEIIAHSMIEHIKAYVGVERLQKVTVSYTPSMHETTVVVCPWDPSFDSQLHILDRLAEVESLFADETIFTVRFESADSPQFTAPTLAESRSVVATA